MDNPISQVPQPDFQGLTPAQMHGLLHELFEPTCLIQFQEPISPAVLDAIPFLQLMLYYLRHIEKVGEVKLTPKGNLPVSLVKELYQQGWIREDAIEHGIHKLNSEDKSESITILKLIAQLAKLTKKRNGKLSLTQNGLKLLSPEKTQELFQLIFTVNAKDFNLGYHDAYPQHSGFQLSLGYFLYLLMKNGPQPQPVRSYSDAILIAFPILKDFFLPRFSTQEEMVASCLKTRFLTRFLAYYGFVMLEENEAIRRMEKKGTVLTTASFHACFKLVK